MTKRVDTCASCGHARMFHSNATLAAGTCYCDYRYAFPCPCAGFQEHTVGTDTPRDVRQLSVPCPTCNPDNSPAVGYGGVGQWCSPARRYVCGTRTAAFKHSVEVESLRAALADACDRWETAERHVYYGKHERWTFESERPQVVTLLSEYRAMAKAVPK